MSRRNRKLKRFKKEKKHVIETIEKPKEKKNIFLEIFEKKYKVLLLIPVIMLVLALVQIGTQSLITGDFLNKGVSLKGGITVTVPVGAEMDILKLKSNLAGQFPGVDFSIRSLASAGQTIGVIIDADLKDITTMDKLLEAIESETDAKKNSFGVETIEPSLGKSFFRETFIAILIAFLFMGIVVFLYFRTFIPSMAVILAAFSDMVVTLAIINLLGIKLSTAGIAAFLMLIGYSVDTDILLSTRVLKREEGTVFERVVGAMKTGLTMNITTLAAITIALFIAQSEVLRQIMTIIFIGLLVDIINTWLQNAGILRWYMEKKHNV